MTACPAWAAIAAAAAEGFLGLEEVLVDDLFLVGIIVVVVVVVVVVVAWGVSSTNGDGEEHD